MKTMQVMACRPVDTTGLPPPLQELYDQLPVLEDPVEYLCEGCSEPVLMGRRQSVMYMLSPEEFLVGCFMCVAKAQRVIGKDKTHLTHLGGK